MMYRGMVVGLLGMVVGSAVAVEQQQKKAHFPDIAGSKTLLCDLHVHTMFSDGSVWPTVRVNEAVREGLDVIAITDHIEYRPHKEDVSANLNRSYEVTVEFAKKNNVLLIRGTEITRDTPPGHFNVLFLTDINPLNVKDFYEPFRIANEQKAYVFWNHPGWQGPERGRWGKEQTQLFEKKWMHGIEVCNGTEYYPEAHQWAIEKKLPIVGNSDIHAPSSDMPGTSDNHRTVTLVFAKERSLEAVRESLFAGRTAVWYKNQIIGKEDQLAPLFAACVQIRRSDLGPKDSSVWFELKNVSDLDIDLEGADDVRPARIHVPAHSAALVNVEILPSYGTEGVPYRAANFLAGPNRPLTVRLAVPGR